MNDRPKLLIVEDNIQFRERLHMVTSSVPTEISSQTGISGFNTDSVSNFGDAVLLFEKAENQRVPYEVMLIDLSIPKTEVEERNQEHSQAHGRNLIEYIRKKSSVGILILSAYKNEENLYYALRHGVNEFMSKSPWSREIEGMMLINLVKVVGVTRERTYKELRLKRSNKLTLESKKTIYREVSRKITRMAKDIHDEMDEMGNLLKQRYGIDPRRDSGDPLYRNLDTIRNISNELIQTISINSTEEDLQVISISDMVKQCVLNFQPCYQHRNVKLIENIENTDLSTKTIATDSRQLIEELIFGSLEKCSEKDVVSVAVQSSKNDIIVSLAYPNKPGLEKESNPDEVINALNNVEPITEKIRERWNGIIFLWELSRNIGVRVDVKQLDQNNVIILTIPVIE